MVDTESKLTQLATEFANAFEKGNRDDGKEFCHLANGSPQWMLDAIHEAHGDIMPNDWIYEHCSRVADKMSEYEPQSWDDSVSEWADSLVDVYNADRATWLASNLSFGFVVDDAVEELGHSDQGIYGDLGYGQYRLLEQIGAALIAAVRNEAEADEDSDLD